MTMEPSSPREPQTPPENGNAPFRGLKPRMAGMMRFAGVVIGLNEARLGHTSTENLVLWFAILLVAGVDTAQAIALRLIDRIFGNGRPS